MEYQLPLTGWVWPADWRDGDCARLVYFRKALRLEAVPAALKLGVSADSRYKLYVNGKLISLGPSKGDRMVWFEDEADIAPYLAPGENVIAVEVMRYPTIHEQGNHSVFRTSTPGLFVKEKETGFGLSAVDGGWKCRPSGGFAVVPEQEYFVPLQIFEDRRGEKDILGWKLPGYDDSGWEEPVPYNIYNMWQAISPCNMSPRTIPMMRLEPRKFTGLFGNYASSAAREDWNAMLRGEGKVTLPARSTETVELTAGELNTGFLSLRLSGGEGAHIKLLTSEAYVREECLPGTLTHKGDRCDWENGRLEGFCDNYTVCGGENEAFEPFWFRTFRFIRLEITTADAPLTVTGFDYLETGYPLEAVTKVETSDETLGPVWDISLRTLRRCMHETYEDCPYYEQLQYAMDSRSQILYTYMVSADDRLARKCMDDFRRSQRPDGMINCSYPSYGPNVIPGFAIYYILMLHDHMMFFGDREFLRGHMGAVDNILEFFRRNLNADGLVGSVGGRNIISPYWSFIDWTSQWDETSGMPRAGLSGPITMESLLYAMGLTHAADVMEFAGRAETAAEYRQRAEAVKEAVKRCCTGEDGMLRDGPEVSEYSQHCQVFGLLTDVLTPEQGRKNLLKTLEKPEDYAQCSVAMAYYLFRALEKAGLYERTEQCWDLWRDMVKKNLTTCVEDGVRQRSDCHAWGALALYELPAAVLGVRPAAPGFAKIRISPTPGYYTWAEGQVATPKGVVSVSWKLGPDGRPQVEYTAPEGVEVVR